MMQRKEVGDLLDLWRVDLVLDDEERLVNEGVLVGQWLMIKTRGGKVPKMLPPGEFRCPLLLRVLVVLYRRLQCTWLLFEK